MTPRVDKISKHPVLAPLCGYGLAAALTGMSALARWMVPWALTPAPYLGFYPAVVVSAALGGVGPGLFSTFASLLLVNVVFGHFNIHDTGAVARQVIWIAASIGVSALAGSQRTARIRERKQAMELRILNDNLELRVKERTAEIQEANRQLREADELRRYELLSKYSRDIILFIDYASGRLIDANVAAVEAYGYLREELLGKTIHDLRADDTRESTVGQLEEAAAHGAQFQTVHRRKDGSTFPVDVSSRGALIGQSKTLISVIRDNTERKRAEEALQASEAELIQAQRVAHLGNWSWDARTDQGTASDELLRIYGFDPATQGMPTFAEQRGLWYPPEEWDRLNSAVQESARTGIGYDLEVQALRNGQRIWVQTRCEAVRDSKGQVVGLRGIVQDITERKLTDETLRRSGERLRLAQQAARIGSFEWHIDKQVAEWSPELEALYGLPPGSIGGSYEEWTALVHPDDLAETERHLGESLASGHFETEWRIVRPDGAIRWLAARGQVHMDRAGKPVRMVGVNLDVTERKEIEEALRRNEARMRAVFDSLVEGVVLLDPAGEVVQINHAVQSLLGHDLQELQDSSLDPRERMLRSDGTLFPVEEQPAILALRTGQAVRDVEMGVPLRDGTIRWRLVNAQPVRDDDGNLLGAVASLFDITERKEAEEALRESERRLLGVLESMPDAFVSFDPDLHYTYLNRNAERLQAVSREELLGKDVRAVYPDPESRKTTSLYERVIAEGKPVTTTSHHAGFDRWVEVRAFPTPDGLSVFFKDVSDKVKTQQALQESEERLRRLGDNLPDSAVYQYVHEPDGRVRFTYFSAGVEVLNGITVAEVMRDPDSLHRQFLPEYRERLLEGEARSRRELSDFDMDVPMRRPDGKIRWMRLHSRPRRLPDGSTVWDGVQIDITEAKEAEAKLESLAQQRQFALDAAHMGWWQYDPVSGLSTWDDGYRKIFGVPGYQLPNDEILARIIHPEDLPGLWAKVERALNAEDPQPFEAEYRITRPDGALRWIEAYGRAFFEERDGQRAATGFVGTVADITARKQTEEMVRGSLAEKEVLLKEIHHRVKNNLQVISSLVSLQAGGSRDETVRGVLGEVSSRVRSMALVHEKLYQSTDLAHIDFADYLRSLLAFIWRAHGTAAGAIRLKLELAPLALPVDTAVPCGLIVNELAGNALKHAFRGREGGEVTVSLESCGDGSTRLRVADNGGGLPAELDWRKASSLGLKLVQMLAGQLDAGVEVSSSRQGSCFEIIINPQGRA